MSSNPVMLPNKQPVQALNDTVAAHLAQARDALCAAHQVSGDVHAVIGGLVGLLATQLSSTALSTVPAADGPVPAQEPKGPALAPLLLPLVVEVMQELLSVNPHARLTNRLLALELCRKPAVQMAFGVEDVPDEKSEAFKRLTLILTKVLTRNPKLFQKGEGNTWTFCPSVQQNPAA